MHPQLEQIADEFHFATARLHALSRAVPAEKWAVRRDPERWSVAECVAHLNLTGAAYDGILREALNQAPRPAAPYTGKYRRDFFGWLLWKTMSPPVRFRTRTIPAFIPESADSAGHLVTEFERWQEAQLARLAEADGLALNELRVTSPFNADLRYNLYSCFSILPAHQHRHLWQAERLW